MANGKLTVVMLMFIVIANIGRSGAIKCFVCTDTMQCKTGIVNYPSWTEVAGCDYCKITIDSMNTAAVMHTCEHNTAGMKGCSNPRQWESSGQPLHCCCVENLCNTDSCSPSEYYRVGNGAVNVRKPITTWMLLVAVAFVGVLAVAV